MSASLFRIVRRVGTRLLPVLLGASLCHCNSKREQGQAAPTRNGAAAPAATPPATNQLQVVESALAFDYGKAAAQAGAGPYDVVLLAVRSRLPFAPKDGSLPRGPVVYYAEALSNGADAAGLKLLFHGVPLVSTPNPAFPGKVYWRTATNQAVDADSARDKQGPQWTSTGSPTIAQYPAAQATMHLYPRPYECVPAPAPLSLTHVPQQQVYEYQLKADVPLQAKPLVDSLAPAAEPTGGFFVLGVPKQRQYLAAPASATRTAAGFGQTMPAGTTLYGGSGQPAPAEVFGIFRAYTLHSETVPHHLPGQPAQKWLFVTIDETAALLPAD